MYCMKCINKFFKNLKIIDYYFFFSLNNIILNYYIIKHNDYRKS